MAQPTGNKPPTTLADMETVDKNDLDDGHGDEKVEFAEAQAATAKEHNLTLPQALKAYPKAIAWSILLSSAVVMEGYDTLLVRFVSVSTSLDASF